MLTLHSSETSCPYETVNNAIAARGTVGSYKNWVKYTAAHIVGITKSCKGDQTWMRSRKYMIATYQLPPQLLVVLLAELLDTLFAHQPERLIALSTFHNRYGGVKLALLRGMRVLLRRVEGLSVSNRSHYWTDRRGQGGCSLLKDRRRL